MGFCGCDLGISSCPVALAEYLESSLEGNIIFNTLFMLDDFFSNIFGKRKSRIGKVVINFLRCILALRTTTDVLCSPYNFISRSTLKTYLC